MSFWNDLLRNDYAGTGFIDGGRKQITGWLYKSLRQNKPYDQMARDMLGGNGISDEYGVIRHVMNLEAVNMAPSSTVDVAIAGTGGLSASDGEYLPIVKVAPIYPRRAQSRGVSGYCIVEYTVTTSGAGGLQQARAPANIGILIPYIYHVYTVYIPNF